MHASPAEAVNAETEALAKLGLHDLRSRWRQHLRTTPPAHLSRGLLLRILAYRLQARIYGDLDRETALSSAARASFSTQS